MISQFYRRYSRPLLLAACLAFPFLHHVAQTLPSNNDIETWLPRDSPVRMDYDAFKRTFGAEEVILIGLPGLREDDRLVEALATRIARLPGIRRCWTPARLRAEMRGFDVPDDEIDEHLCGLAVSDRTELIGVVATLSEEGLRDRAATVRDVREVLAYCQLDGENACLAGAPVVVSELDRLGNRESNKRLFGITLAICVGILYWSLRQWNLTLGIMGLTLLSIDGTMALIKAGGGESNFIIGALPVMVMVFTLSIALHFLHYYSAAAHDPDPFGAALRQAWRPFGLSTLTTAIGLFSLTTSNIAPVNEFGPCAALGSFVSLGVGLGLVPALLTVFPLQKRKEEDSGRALAALADWIVSRSGRVTAVALVLVAVTIAGIMRIESKIDPLDFLPPDGRVRRDIARIEEELTSTGSIEAVVDFGGSDLPFVDRLAVVRRLEEKLDSHPAVRHTISAASFFPREMPQGLAAAGLLRRAQERREGSDFVAAGGDLWRISARVSVAAGERNALVSELEQLTAGEPITFTGVGPLLELAQQTIFTGFWSSFTSAFAVIAGVMVFALRSLKTGIVAMLPSLCALCVVYGILGWIDFPVDIGMMMTASIVVGISVDETFHFLVRFQHLHRRLGDRRQAVRLALMHTGAPIIEAVSIASLGMLALTLSHFAPTVRFGYLMAALLITIGVANVVLLPALLALRGDSGGTAPPIRKSRRGPAFTRRRMVKSQPAGGQMIN